MLCWRRISAIGTPASPCFKISTIWLSVNRDFRMGISLAPESLRSKCLPKGEAYGSAAGAKPERTKHAARPAMGSTSSGFQRISQGTAERAGPAAISILVVFELFFGQKPEVTSLIRSVEHLIEQLLAQEFQVCRRFPGDTGAGSNGNLRYSSRYQRIASSSSGASRRATCAVVLRRVSPD